MKISGAIFDMDGTLIDSMHMYSGEDFLRSKGITPLPHISAQVKALPLYEGLALLKDAYSLCESVDELLCGLTAYIEDFYANKVLPRDGIPELLQHLKSQGVKMCVATATDLPLAQIALAHCKIDSYFSHIFTCRDVGQGKVSPTIYRASLAHLQTPKAETWVFEDAFYAANTAAKDGFNVMGIKDPSEDNVAGMAEVCTKYANDAFEIMDILNHH